MSERGRVYQVVDAVPDCKLSYAIAYLQGLTDAGRADLHRETLASVKELEDGGEYFEGSTKDFFNKMLED